MQKQENNIPPIENFILQGLLEWVRSMFNTPNVTFISTSDRFRVAKVREGVEKPLTDTQMFLHLTELSLNPQERGNIRSIVRQGTYTSTFKDESVVRRLIIIPVQYAVEVIYLTPDFNEGIKFAKKWLIGSQKGELNYTITYDSVGHDIQVRLAPTVNVPDKDTAADVPNNYEYITTLEIFGHMSDTDDITHVPIIEETVLGIGVMSSDGTGRDIDKTYSKKWDDPAVTVTETGPTKLHNI